MVYRTAVSIVGLIVLAILSGCASLTEPIDPPKVTIDNFTSLPSAGSGPQFEITLRIQNPNAQTLDIAGISYGIELAGREVISGVSNDVPVIEGYSEGLVTLNASLQFFQVLKLLASLGQTTADEMTYRFTAKIDFKGLIPTQRVEEEGQITLN
ncbi:MAG: LEA type 2 family protein [Pseudomonadota bacterium]